MKGNKMLKHKLLLSIFWITFSLLWVLPTSAETIVDTSWVRIYNGPGNSGDFAYDVAVDDSGCVYVTGTSYGGITTANDYVTIKYYPDGDTAWLRRYNGPGSAGDEASGIAADASGNVYVTGVSWGGGTGRDVATIKYLPNGDTDWIRRYSGVDGYDDGGYAITTDSHGNVYVTGYSFISSSDSDFLTVKYNPEGDTVWVRTYGGAANMWDEAYSIVVDDSGNVYVNGDSWGSATLQDYATVKYDSDGNQLWAKRYDGPGGGEDHAHSLTVDGYGNVYVTGSSDGGSENDDYATIKYNASGDTIWVRRYNGPGNGEDHAYAIALDKSDNVYVTGMSPGSGSASDYATIKYFTNGDTAWVRRYNGPGNATDKATEIVVDDSGSVYVAGRSYDPGSSYDVTTIKYDSDGEECWIKRYDGSGNQYDYPHDMILDGDGGIYMAGESVGSGTAEDFLAIKYLQALRGDANGDGIIDPSDIVYLINYFFRNGPAPTPPLAGDANSDGLVDPADVVYLINYLFRNGSPPGESRR
jgi:uncharacterized delta-60 repeat protein